MFAKLATILAVGARHALPPKAVPGHRTDRVPPRGRSNLRCRWHLDLASGRPVCTWEIDDPPPAATGGRRIGAPRRLDRNKVKRTARVAVAAVDA